MWLRFSLQFSVLVLGLTGAMLATPVSAQMTRLWTKDYEQGTRRVHIGRAVGTDGREGVFVTGSSTSASNGRDFLTRKYHLITGESLWLDRYDGTGDADDDAYALVVDSQGDVIVVGSSTGPEGADLDFFVRKLSGVDGSTLWLKRDNGTGSGEDAAYAVALGPDDSVAVVGTSTGPGNNGKDFYTVKYNAAGERQWVKRHNATASGDDVALAVVVDGEGNVVATGYSENAAGDKDFYTAKYAGTDGALLWSDRYNTTGGDDVALAIAVDQQNNVVVVGYSGATRGDEKGGAVRVIKYAAEGDVLWNKSDTGSGTGINAARALVINEQGDAIVAGTVANVASGQDFRVRAFAAADGATLWTHTDNGTGNDDDTATAVALNSQGQVIVTGLSTGTADVATFLTRGLDGRSGDLLWSERASGAEALAAPGGLALGPGGSVIVHGSQITAEAPEEGEAPSKYLTIVYARSEDQDADGLPDAWETTHWENIGAFGAPDDPDSDGVVNLLEYAFGLSPVVSDAVHLPFPVVEEGYLTVTLTKKPGVTFWVETSQDLAVWRNNIVVLEEDETTFKVRDAVLGSSPGEPRFMRVRVTAP